MMESYNLSLEDLSETFQPDESIYIAEFINSLDVTDKMKLKYMDIFLENIDDDILSEAEEDHYYEVSDLQWDLRNNVDFQKICISHTETQGTKSCRIERRFYENLYIEVLSEDPMATLYHNFLTDFELNIASEEVKKNKFEKGSVRSGEVDFRDQINEVEDSPFFDNVHQRINRVTGLNSGDAVMEIFKYRLGGAHTPHTDFYNEDYIRKEVKLGNRVAIAMIFLRETIKGGGFAMPRLTVYVAPTPGTLLVWYNVDKMGRNDEDTVHGGCPVYQGTKMIAITEYKALLQQDVCPINEE
ncbi:prolyl 4-hydroxylase subunit alpha-2 [Eurytemora carolleeae]|uniref:prolyl 4-hydroxylase subunit alpha-2 n=1 Tax=Eurytemora carolleeae TaxID=1294199 RepID=UPI000C761CB1|nr:prolyl 4-hydroxylase subunit alpha-2 [Eurytemora carolleeae]|eukprot:XP_023323008.1 prolyl 4-hydroxylase subunit alpha-2-like [Eurytemora affinis]